MNHTNDITGFTTESIKAVYSTKVEGILCAVINSMEDSYDCRFDERGEETFVYIGQVPVEKYIWILEDGSISDQEELWLAVKADYKWDVNKVLYPVIE